MAAEDYLPPDWDDEYWGEASSVTCKFCGRRGLHWANDGRKWYLVDDNCYPHVCSEKDLHRKAINDFEELT